MSTRKIFVLVLILILLRMQVLDLEFRLIKRLDGIFLSQCSLFGYYFLFLIYCGTQTSLVLIKGFVPVGP